jgi:hypothetical protein
VSTSARAEQLAFRRRRRIRYDVETWNLNASGKIQAELPARAMQKLTIHPATPKRWPALEHLFGNRGACGGGWCMYWRIGNEYRRRPQKANRSDLHKVVIEGPPPGLIAFEGDLAVGWCQLTPRAMLGLGQYATAVY